MFRLLTFILAFGAIGYIAYKQVSNGTKANGELETSRPKQQLDNVRQAAKRIEANDQQHLDDVDRRTRE